LTSDIESNSFFVNYRYKNWNFIAGNLPPSSEFLTLGKGVGIRYAKDQDTRFSVSASLHDKNLPGNLQNDLITATADYQIKKLKISQVFNANFDRYRGLNSYLLINYLSLIRRQRFQFDILLGGGMEEKIREVPGLAKYTEGKAAGYQLFLLKNDLRFDSRLHYYSPGFPGLHRGNLDHYHELKLVKNSKFISLFYHV